MTDQAQSDRPRLLEILRVFARIGAMSYGGAAIMGIMQVEIRERRGWLTKERYLEGMALVNMLPGAPATQLAIFLGHDRAGWRGGVLAGIGFVLPAFFVMLALTLLYSAYGTLSIMRDAFYGLGPVVLGIFVVTVIRLSRVALTGRPQIAIAVAAALLAAFTPIGTAGTLLLAGCAGVALSPFAHEGSARCARGHAADRGVPLGERGAGPGGNNGEPGRRRFRARSLGHRSFFLHAGAFTFGGGITVLAFVQDQLVNQLHWLTPREFLDGLALGQLTPGPVLMLAAYVGYKLCGLAGAAVGAFAIFLPSFILVLSVLPVLNRFRELAWIKAAMRAIGAAVIGVLAVSLAHLAPHAAPDAFTMLLMGLTIAAMLAWSIAPLKMIVAGSLVGIISRLKPVPGLKDLA